MNTPSHIIINLAVLRRPEQLPFTWPIILGAIAPDAAIFVFYAWAKWGQKLPESEIWSKAYYSQPWQDIFAVGNSIPLALVGIGASLYFNQIAWGLFFASMILHHLADLPLHHDDAHRHFFPFSDARFTSPVSYWDRSHYGTLGALIELLIVLTSTVVLLSHTSSPVGKGLMVLTNGLMLAVYYLAYLRPLWS
jgi:hypothetical protein